MSNGNRVTVTVTKCVVCGNPSYGRRYCGNACKMRNYRQGNGKLLALNTNVTDNEDSNLVPETMQEPTKLSRYWRTEITSEDWKDQKLLAKLKMDGWSIVTILFFKNISGLTGGYLCMWLKNIASACHSEGVWYDLQDEDTHIGRAFKEFQNQYYKPKY